MREKAMAKQVAFGAVLGALLTLGNTALGADPDVPIYACQGFEPPMNLSSLPPAMGGGVIARKVATNRVLPFKATLVDADGNRVTDVVAAPRLQVLHKEGTTGPESNIAEDALWSGQGTEGNAFELSGTTWQFNLKAKNSSAPGRYTATMESGDPNEYAIDPHCEGVFLIE
jgi:hypothetical protein